MAEPTSTTAVAAYAAAASGITLAVLGVDYYSLVYGMVGAFLALGSAGDMGKGRAVAYVILSTIVGAALGTAAVEFFSVTSKAALFVGCVVGGAGSQTLVGAFIKAVVKRIDNEGEKS